MSGRLQPVHQALPLPQIHSLAGPAGKPMVFGPQLWSVVSVARPAFPPSNPLPVASHVEKKDMPPPLPLPPTSVVVQPNGPAAGSNRPSLVMKLKRPPQVVSVLTIDDPAKVSEQARLQAQPLATSAEPSGSLTVPLRKKRKIQDPHLLHAIKPIAPQPKVSMERKASYVVPPPRHEIREATAMSQKIRPIAPQPKASMERKADYVIPPQAQRIETREASAAPQQVVTKVRIVVSRPPDLPARSAKTDLGEKVDGPAKAPVASFGPVLPQNKEKRLVDAKVLDKGHKRAEETKAPEKARDSPQSSALLADASSNHAEISLVKPLVRPDNTPAAVAAHLALHLYTGPAGPEILRLKDRFLDLEGNRELWLVEWKDTAIAQRMVTDAFLSSHAAYQIKMVDYFATLNPPLNVPGDFEVLAQGMTVYREGRSEKVEEVTAEVAAKVLLVREKDKEKTSSGDPLDFLFREIPDRKERNKSGFREEFDSLFPLSSFVLEDRKLSEASLWNSERKMASTSRDSLQGPRRSRRLEDPDFSRLFSSSRDDFYGFLEEVAS